MKGLAEGAGIRGKNREGVGTVGPRGEGLKRSSIDLGKVSRGGTQ